MTRLARFREKLAPLAGAALITSPQNQFYLSEVAYDDGYLLILPDAAYLLADFRYIEAVRGAAGGDFTVLRPEGGMDGAVRELLHKHRVDTLLLEEGHVTIGGQSRLSTRLEGVKFVSGATRILSGLREIKDEKELAAMAAAQELTDAAFTHILGYIRKGVREIDVALELEFFMRKNGAQGLAFDTIVVSGSASSLPHGIPRDLPLENGFLTMDFGARFGGYCSDMTRTVVIGRADAEMRHLYQTVLTAQQAALSRIGAGELCREMDGVARHIIEEAGYKGCFGHSLGHGVGLDIHEAPRLSPAALPEAVLHPGQVVTVEPGIYLEGKYGCRIEDMVAILPEGGVRNFTKSTKELLEL